MLRVCFKNAVTSLHPHGEGAAPEAAVPWRGIVQAVAIDMLAVASHPFADLSSIPRA